MNVLIIKMSSLGDVIHCLPALNDTVKAIGDVSFDWVVEEAFASIPANSSQVHKVIPIAFRRWRKHLFSINSWREFFAFRRQLREKKYDLIIDAQGLLKSAVVAKLARGHIVGYDRESIREPLASFLYQTAYQISKNQHAIERLRQLFSKALSLPDPETETDYGLSEPVSVESKRVMLVHGTTWPSKEWPLVNWIELAQILVNNGYIPCLTWGNGTEKDRCDQIKGAVSGVELINKIPLEDLMTKMKHMTAAVTVDTGLGHLAAAMGMSVVSIYGSTDPLLTGIKARLAAQLFDKDFPCTPCRKRNCQYQYEKDSAKLYPPCYQHATPEKVWEKLQLIIPQTI